MSQKIIDCLYIFIMIMLFILAIYSVFDGPETSMFENVSLMLFATIITIAMLCCVLFDEGKQKDEENNDQGE